MQEAALLPANISEAQETDLVATARLARASAEQVEADASPSRWMEADCYAELSRRGWSERKIGATCDVSDTSVHFFLQCVRAYLGKQRPAFWVAYQEAKKGVHPAPRQPVPPPPVGKFSTIVIDPPWPIQKSQRTERPNQTTMDYSSMSIEAIKEFPVCSLADEHAHLYLWTTHKHLEVAFSIVRDWGFKYHCLLTWVKPVGFTPFSWMFSTEHVLFCRRGNLPMAELGLRVDFTGPVREHSRKPDEFFDLVRRVSPEPRIELYAREHHNGFSAWGDEPERFKLEGGLPVATVISV